MGNQRKSGDGKHLIEKINGQQIRGKSYAHGGRKRKSEERVEACLGVLMQSSHISDGVKRGGDPENGCDQGKEKARSIHPEEHRYIRKYLPDMKFYDTPTQDEW